MVALMRTEILDLLATMSVEDMGELYWELEQRLSATKSLDVSKNLRAKRPSQSCWKRGGSTTWSTLKLLFHGKTCGSVSRKEWRSGKLPGSRNE